MRIAVDMDGVLADFHSTAIKYHGNDYKNLTPTEFWEPLRDVDDLFLEIGVLDDAHRLVEYLSYLKDDGHDVFVLTAIPIPTGKLSSAAQNKIDWFQRHFGDVFRVETSLDGKYKKAWVRQLGDILIDDMHRNIKEWESVGGRGILHTDAESTIKQLRFFSI